MYLTDNNKPRINAHKRHTYGVNMFKSILILIFMIITMQSVYAKQFINGKIAGVEIAAVDETGRESLCITYLHSETSSKTYGIVEDLYDCYYARKFSKVIGSTQKIPSGYLFSMYEGLNDYLLTNKANVQYVFSETE